MLPKFANTCPGQNARCSSPHTFSAAQETAPKATKVTTDAPAMSRNAFQSISTLTRVAKIRHGMPKTVVRVMMKSASKGWPRRFQTKPMAAHTNTGAMMEKSSVSILTT